eukprot:TRINITY_DN37189_c0_g2_i1.p1 TRINITY_DN37189_c0_g2~~TRINITY_DN37189_c0_g2_i1.p1  ORF type:complete len:251 (+),score=33.78 TRINITY_DN37189_c0_g2_i1:75-827(+)
MVGGSGGGVAGMATTVYPANAIAGTDSVSAMSWPPAPNATVRTACAADPKSLTICEEKYCGGDGCVYPTLQPPSPLTEVQQVQGQVGSPDQGFAHDGLHDGTAEANIGVGLEDLSDDGVGAMHRGRRLNPKPRMFFDPRSPNETSAVPGPGYVDAWQGPAMQPSGGWTRPTIESALDVVTATVGTTLPLPCPNYASVALSKIARPTRVLRPGYSRASDIALTSRSLRPATSSRVAMQQFLCDCGEQLLQP